MPRSFTVSTAGLKHKKSDVLFKDNNCLYDMCCKESNNAFEVVCTFPVFKGSTENLIYKHIFY
jgi:hypothetical protein